ncbi:MAG: ECF transporter S component [Anaerovoracaceae bacterium]
MEAYSIRDLTFTYPKSHEPVLTNISLNIVRGEFITLCGSSGSGKTTLLRQLKSSLTPYGGREGEVFFEGEELAKIPQEVQAAKIGFVMQDPENQIVTDKVWHELAFGLESLGYETEEIRLRVGEMASYFGIQDWFYKDVHLLSGGQKQILNLASILAMDPRVIILDEPTAQLDPLAASGFINELYKINRDLGVTVIISEHRLEDVLPLSDRVLIVERGSVIFDGIPGEIASAFRGMGQEILLSMPAPIRIYASIDNNLAPPTTIREGRAWLSQIVKGRQLEIVEDDEGSKTDSARVAMRVSDLWFRYGKNHQDVVKGFSLSVDEGELLAILGANGAGKTTAVNLMGGLLKPFRGKVYSQGKKVLILPQNPQNLFVKKTVGEDLEEALEDLSMDVKEKNIKIGEVIRLCSLEGVLDQHPYDISGGEQQRAALAKVLLRQPEILIMDEPTKGMDGWFKRRLGGIIKELKGSGVAVIMVSHDVEFCARYADRCALFFDGGILSQGRPKSFFSNNRFYTTGAAKMVKDILPGAVTADQVIRVLGGSFENAKIGGMGADIEGFAKDNGSLREETPMEPGDRYYKRRGKEKDKGKRFLGMDGAIFLIAIPATILMGMYWFGDRKYYFISLLILLEAMLPFAYRFEKSKPGARKIVTIAVLCAIGVAARAAFFMIPQFKPVVAVVIIAGLSLGRETGFYVGSLTAFLSNFFFGQGPWTPWQMFALGIVGFLAGVMELKGLSDKGIGSICLFGFLATFFVYGGLMNSASILIFQGHPTWGMFLTAYLYGIPFDLIHAISTAIILYFIADPMLEKLNRIKVKYGLT